MTTSASTHELSTSALAALTAELRVRAPRQAAANEIEITPMPVRTCYETMTRITGPRDAVLDYAAFLFSGEGAGAPQPTPPLAIEEAHVDTATGTLTLVLSRGSFTVR